jgi:hypothetical protein
MKRLFILLLLRIKRPKDKDSANFGVMVVPDRNSNAGSAGPRGHGNRNHGICLRPPSVE